MKLGDPEYVALLEADPLVNGDGLYRLDLKVGDGVIVGRQKDHTGVIIGQGRCGTVIALCNNTDYPVRVMLEGDSRETQPIYFQIERGRK